MRACCTFTAGSVSAIYHTDLSPARHITGLRGGEAKSSAAPQRRRRVVTSARAQSFAYLNMKPRQQSSAGPQTRSTTKILPELSNLLPFLSAWGALMLSEGAGLPEWLVLLNLTWGAGASVAAGIVLEKLKIESKPIQMRLDNAPMGIRRGGKLPMKDLVKAADGSVEGLKQLLKQEWELPEDTRVAVYGVDYDGAEFEFTPMVAHDLKGTLAGAQAVLLRVMPLQHVVSAHSHVPSLSSSE